MTVAVILAGGLGTRLRSAVPDLPKPMAEVSGRPFLEYLMDYWIGQGVSEFVLSVGYKRDKIIAHFGKSYRAVPVSYVEEVEPLGTGGGLVLAARRLTMPFLLLNGDTFFEVSLKELLAFHRSAHSRWTIAMLRANEADRYGAIQIDEASRILELKTSKGAIGDLVNGGVYLIEPSLINAGDFVPGSKYSLEDEVLANIINMDERVMGLEQSGRFLDIGVPKDYHAASNLVVKGSYK